MKQAPLRLDPVGAAGGAPTAVSGAVPGGPRAAPAASGRSPQPATGTTGPSATAPAAEPSAAGGSRANPSPAPSPESEAPSPPSGEPTPTPSSNAPIEQAPSKDPAPGTPVPNTPTPTSAAPPGPVPTAAAATTSGSTAPDSAISASTTSTANLSVHGPASVRVGEEFDVVIDASITGSLPTLSLLIRFDPKVLTFVEVNPTELARNSGIAGTSPKLDTDSGRLDVDLQAVGNPLSGQGKLLNLRFAATTARTQTTIAVGQAALPGNVGARAALQPSSLRLRVAP